MIIAGIVTFNPDLKRLSENINAVINQVQKLVIVDNGSTNVDQIKDLITNEGIILIELPSNEGVAKALNIIMEYGLDHGAEWVLTLDQDSVVNCSLIANYSDYFYLDKVGMFTCRIEDRNISEDDTNLGDEPFEIVDRCITSGSLTNIKAWNQAGRFDEDMFIDFVDFDLCMKMRKIGYSIVRINSFGLLHEIGHSKKIRLFNKEQVVYNHPPIRKYYIVRNRIYYIHKHAEIINMRIEIKALVRYIVLVLLFENNKITNLQSILHGMKDAWVLIAKEGTT